MAYFACGEAAKTGTDKSTRTSIAKGLVSPTYISTVTGKEHLRGVVQLDVISGQNMDYVTSQSVTDRIASALGINRGSKVTSGKKTVSTSAGQVQQAQLHASDPAVIKTSTMFGLSKKVIAIGIALVVGLYVVVSR